MRIRTVSGVTSMHSSSRQNSRDCSRESLRAGTTFSVVSADAARMLVSFFSLVMLTSMSSAREFSPMIMPSYTSVPASVKMTPRSCRLTIANGVTEPERSATSEPL